MIYNVDFLIASLVFLLIILRHFVEQRTLDVKNNRTFLWLLIVGIANIIFDLLCTVLISYARPGLAWLTEICLVLLYVLQLLVPHALLCHIQNQLLPSGGGKLTRCLMLMVFPLLMILLVLTNHWTGFFFTVYRSGAYVRGPAYGFMYLFAGIYLLTAAIFCTIHASDMEPGKVRAVWELVICTGATVVLQSVFNDILVTSFGITLGITVLFFTLNNPYHYTDTLTATYDVRYFHNRCANYLEHKREFHVLAVDLSQIDTVNRIMGTGSGDRILVAVAEKLRSFGRQNLVFRISGKVFLMILQSREKYEEVREAMIRYFSDSIYKSAEEISSSAVICGVKNAERLKNSETLLAYVKYLIALEASPAETCLIEDDDVTLEGFRYNQEIEGFLHTALHQDLFTVMYQPIYDMKEGGFTTLEVLSRLNHPVLGPVSPAVFITIAERTDQIARIGLLQLRRVCKFLAEHQEIRESLRSVKMNLSPAELMKTGHVDQMIDTIREYGLPTSFFQFEITETVATEYNKSLNRIMDKFEKAGIALCLDDFGSGYANLNTVLKLPFSVVKLDRSLLFGICNDEKTASLYRSLVNSLHTMGFCVVAEGVETPEELHLVSAWGVDMVQGFCFSRPVPGKQLLELLKTRNPVL